MPVRRTRGSGDGRPRPVLTGRALVLGGVLVLLIVVLASPAQHYLASRGSVSSSAQQLRDDRAALARLQRQQSLWADPGYIQQQARARLQYAMPGDTVFVTVDQGARNDIRSSSTAARTAAGGGWNDRLMASVRTAAK